MSSSRRRKIGDPFVSSSDAPRANQAEKRLARVANDFQDIASDSVVSDPFVESDMIPSDRPNRDLFNGTAVFTIQSFRIVTVSVLQLDEDAPNANHDEFDKGYMWHVGA
jgi:hypothetical protein